MFSKLFIKIKNMMINHAILSLCLGGAITFEILTGFAYFVPNVAKIISYVLAGITGINILISFIFIIIYERGNDNTKPLQHADTGFIFTVASFITFILAFVLAGELVIFKGWWYLGVS